MKEKKQLTREEKLLASYRAKLRREGLLKACLTASICGFALSVIVSAVSFAMVSDLLFIALGVWAAATAGLTALFYRFLFRPDLSATARRVDGMGLEERVVTMVELSGREDVLAGKQRKDTEQALSSVGVKQMRTGIPKVLLAVLLLVMALAVFMMSYSTVLAVRAQETENPIEEEHTPTPSEQDDAIIREMIEKLREEIDAAPVDGTLKSYLHQIVDDLEASLKPTDSLEVKIARVSETAQRIHKLIEEYLSRTTIGQELQKHETTKPLGDAVVTGDIEIVKDAFQAMYDSIEPHVMAGEYDILAQTADDIEQSIYDATIPDEQLEEALQKLADALRAAIPKQPPEEGEEEHVGDEVMKEVQDAFDQAVQDMQDVLEGEKEKAEAGKNADELDKEMQDTIQDALDKLNGKEQETEPEDPEEPEEPEEPGEEQGGEQGANPPPTDGDVKYDSVIDGETSYKDVEYEEQFKELLESDTLTDEQRKAIEDYLEFLGTEKP